MEAIFGIACVGAMLFVYFAPAAWAVGDAQKRGQSGGWVVLLFWLFGPASALVWLVVRPRSKVVDRSPDDYADPEDALAAAASLDQLGEWDAAIGLYEIAAQRWPEQYEYIAACIQQIKEKQSLA